MFAFFSIAYSRGLRRARRCAATLRAAELHGQYANSIRSSLLGIAASRSAGAVRLTDQDQRAAQAAQLASKGFTIDVPIMVWAWDPYLVMTLRSNYGYTWVPSALQPAVTMAPGISIPGAVPYDPAHPPAGSIHVSTNIQDYPPFNPPAQPAPPTPPSNDPVGPQSVGTLYLTVPGETYPDGAQVSRMRGGHS